MNLPPVLLIHGAATSGRVWRRLVPLLEAHGYEVRAPDRPCSGDLEEEISFLEPLSRDAVLVGVSGGATLGWELVSRTSCPAAAVLHEPAAGSLRPGLLAGPLKALEEGGPASFARTLYGTAWTEEEMADSRTVPQDVAMFAGFEPQPPHPKAGPVQLTVGGASPPVRHEVAEAFELRFGLPAAVLPQAGHAVHLERPELLAGLVLQAASRQLP